MQGFIRAHENPLAMRAGALSVLVHGVLLAILLVSFNWKTVQPLNIAEVELWDNLPSPVQEIKPIPEPPKPEPIVEPEAPKPIIEPKPEPKAEIELKKEPVKEAVKPPPKKVEKPKPDPAIKVKEDEKKHQEALKKLQQQMLAAEDQQQSEKNEAQEASDKAAQVASAGEINKYITDIQRKIRGKVIKQLCGTGNPELEFAIALMPTGEVNGDPKLLKGSGMDACDRTVESAILQAQPLPVPSEPDLFSQFRNLKLKFRPNADN